AIVSDLAINFGAASTVDRRRFSANRLDAIDPVATLLRSKHIGDLEDVRLSDVQFRNDHLIFPSARRTIAVARRTPSSSRHDPRPGLCDSRSPGYREADGAANGSPLVSTATCRAGRGFVSAFQSDAGRCSPGIPRSSE